MVVAAEVGQEDDGDEGDDDGGADCVALLAFPL